MIQNPLHTSAAAYELLERAAPMLRLPTSPDLAPEVLADGSGLRCRVTGQIFPYREGVLHLLGKEPTFTETQHLLNTRVTAWAYDRFRDGLLRLAHTKGFPHEVAAIQQHLAVSPGDTVLDLACGHGIFTVEWAKRVGHQGLVIGLDIAPAMLARAAAHVRAWDLRNVLLIRGDALQLPFADGTLSKINCSGGFHQLPDLSRAIDEISRVSRPQAALTASTFAEGANDRHRRLKRWLHERFAFHFVPLEGLGEDLRRRGYTTYIASLPGGWFGYAAATRVG